MHDFRYIIVGLLVGFFTGLTGIGGGSLMTPILILFMGIAPSKAVGTDLFFAAITKISSYYYFLKEGYINWRIVKLLSIGSIPSACVTMITLKWLNYHDDIVNILFNKAIAVVVILLACLYLIQLRTKTYFSINFNNSITQERLTILAGSLIGIMVTLTSIGAGVLGTIAIIAFYPKLKPVSLIATEIAHAVPLALLAGIGHASVGNINVEILVQLIIGSLPAAYIGSKIAVTAPIIALRIILSFFLLFIGFKLIVIT